MGVMKGKDSDKFEIRFDDTAPEPIDPEDMENRRFDRLRLRITLVAVIVPCLLGVLLAAGYIDLKRRMAAVDTTGMTEVRKVSKTLESSFSSVSVQVAKLEEDVNSRLASMEKDLSAVNRRLGKIEEGLEQLGQSKVDAKALSAAVKQRQDALGAVEKRIDDAVSRISADQEAFGKSLNAIQKETETTASRIETLQTEVRAMEAELETLAGLRTDLKVVDLARENDRESLEKRLSGISGELTTRLEQLSRRLAELSRQVEAAGGKSLSGPPKPAPSAPSPAPSADSGTIIEQDLK